MTEGHENFFFMGIVGKVGWGKGSVLERLGLTVCSELQDTYGKYICVNIYIYIYVFIYLSFFSLTFEA